MQIIARHRALYRVQHVVCHMVRSDVSAVDFDRLGNALTFLFISTAKNIIDEEEKVTGSPVESPRRRTSENATY